MAKKTKLLLLMIFIACVLLSACGKSEEASRVDQLIVNIGEVSLNSEAQITEAESSVSALAEQDYKQLEHLNELESARTQYNQLRAEEVEKVIFQIGSITVESEETISTAREYYDDASSAVQALVTNYNLLLEAEEEFPAVCAAEVEELIAKIGTVSLEKEEQIKEARARFNSLSFTAMQMVTNSQVLKDAEDSYKDLEREAQKQAIEEKAKEKALGAIRVEKLWCSTPDAFGGVKLYINFTNKSEKTIKYVNFAVKFHNAVGDVVKCKLKDEDTYYCQATGPYETGEGLSGSNYYWGEYYNSTITSAKLVSLSIDYMDNTSVSFKGTEVDYIQY